MAEDIWRVLVYCLIGTPDQLIPRVSSGIRGAELTLQMHQVYPIHAVLLRRDPGATRMLRPYMGSRGKQDISKSTHLPPIPHEAPGVYGAKI